ncbi:hypothetical protein COO60DRAFT_981245 [Scenedesmus sp. NREL 46B-D3]|nr:hypothetical protein COO60DRAFT_981245 [Scenedesmus sp. NREL 46B-D3]
MTVYQVVTAGTSYNTKSAALLRSGRAAQSALWYTFTCNMTCTSGAAHVIVPCWLLTALFNSKPAIFCSARCSCVLLCCCACCLQTFKALLVGFPGGKICTQQHVPGYAQSAAELKAAGIDKVVAVTVAPPQEVARWAAQHGFDKAGLVQVLSDRSGAFTRLLGLEQPAGPEGPPCQRFAAVVDNGILLRLVRRHTLTMPAQLADTIVDKNTLRHATHPHSSLQVHGSECSAALPLALCTPVRHLAAASGPTVVTLLCRRASFGACADREWSSRRQS